MTLCPIAIAASCKKCPAFSFCPLKTVIGDYVRKLRDAHGVEVEVYGARKLTADTLIQAATRFVPIEGRLLLSS